MRKVTRRFVDAAIKKGWEPYIKSNWIEIKTKPKSGVILSFIGHDEHEYICSKKTANEILRQK